MQDDVDGGNGSLLVGAVGHFYFAQIGHFYFAATGGCERQAAVNACERGCEHAGNAAHRSLSRISHRDGNVEPTQRPDLPRVGTATGRARWGAILVRAAARQGTATVRTTETPRKSFYTGQCSEWGHPLDEALIVRWIGLHFFFSFELSYLNAPRKPRLDVAPVARHEKLLLYAVSLCRMVVCGPERPAAPPQ